MKNPKRLGYRHSMLGIALHCLVLAAEAVNHRIHSVHCLVLLLEALPSLQKQQIAIQDIPNEYQYLTRTHRVRAEASEKNQDYLVPNRASPMRCGDQHPGGDEKE